jgi:hypothetical protein
VELQNLEGAAAFRPLNPACFERSGLQARIDCAHRNR